MKQGFEEEYLLPAFKLFGFYDYLYYFTKG